MTTSDVLSSSRIAGGLPATAPLYALSGTALARNAMRPGPDEHDASLWYALSAERRMALVVLGQNNEKMRSYLAEIRRTPPDQRGQPEQWALVGAALAAMSTAAPAPPPACPAPPPGTPMWVWMLLAGLVVACIGLLVFMMWRRGWRQPFGACVTATAAVAGTTAGKVVATVDTTTAPTGGPEERWLNLVPIGAESRPGSAASRYSNDSA